MAFSIDDLLTVWRKSFDESYTIPLEDDVGADVIAAIAAIFARASESSSRTTQAFYLLPHSIQTSDPSSGEVMSTGSLTITRGRPAYGVVELEEGDPLIVEIRKDDGDWEKEISIELDDDLTLPDGSTTPLTVDCIADRAGYQANIVDTDGRRVLFLSRLILAVSNTTADNLNGLTDTGLGNRFDGSMVGAFVRFTAGPNYPTNPRRITAVSVGTSTTTVTVDGAALALGAGNDVEVIDINTLPVTAELNGDMTGGKHGWLDAIARERDIGRNANENDDVFRDRVKSLPDTISPNAIERACRRILEPIGIKYLFIESRRREHMKGFFCDEDPCDDPNAAIENGGRLLLGSPFDVMGFFIVIERTGEGEFGMFADYDPPGSVGARNAVDFAFADGHPVGFWANMAALIAEIEKTKAAGVPWGFVLVESL
jgi:hypothetical protein